MLNIYMCYILDIPHIYFIYLNLYYNLSKTRIDETQYYRHNHFRSLLDDIFHHDIFPYQNI